MRASHKNTSPERCAATLWYGGEPIGCDKPAGHQGDHEVDIHGDFGGGGHVIWEELRPLDPSTDHYVTERNPS